MTSQWTSPRVFPEGGCLSGLSFCAPQALKWFETTSEFSLGLLVYSGAVFTGANGRHSRHRPVLRHGSIAGYLAPTAASLPKLSLSQPWHAGRRSRLIDLGLQLVRYVAGPGLLSSQPAGSAFQIRDEGLPRHIALRRGRCTCSDLRADDKVTAGFHSQCDVTLVAIRSILQPYGCQ
jgi:hypothetical protein